MLSRKNQRGGSDQQFGELIEEIMRPLLLFGAYAPALASDAVLSLNKVFGHFF